MEIKSHKTKKGTKQLMSPSASPMTAHPWAYAPVFWFCFPKREGSSPSVDMAAKSSGCARMLSNTTKGNNASSPHRTSHAPQRRPPSSKAWAKPALAPDSWGPAAQSANCAKPESSAVNSSVPMRARGIVFVGFLALEAMQHTSSKPMKPKKSCEVVASTAGAPRGKKVAVDWNMFPVQSEKPAPIMKRTKTTLSAVMRLMTTLLQSMPRAINAEHRSTMTPARGSA
mmetsp:Transcript_58069/g.168517  ORF Transcript_58069/g.168517 Transcript_58069/m.168517 type:complete len:227 (+) Transcript_58069:111-791(+)